VRATLIVLDSVGVGAMPDAGEWGDEGADTIGHVAERAGGLKLPNLQALGLGNIRPIEGVDPVAAPAASFGKAAIASAGKDTISGHWEMAGVPVETPFITFPEGFPPDIMGRFHEAIGRGSLANYPASGTVIIEELGREHMETGLPIVYTSADSVFQVAAHEDVVPVETLYAWCRAAFEIVTPRGVARVIARPFVGEPGAFVRTTNRKDFALRPPRDTLVDQISAAGLAATSVGKVKSIFGERGFTRGVKAGHNPEITEKILACLDDQPEGFIFANLVDYDMLYGHRRDPAGYAAALEDFDQRVPEILARMGEGDLLIFTADHGCDPTWSGTDHTREYVPVLAWRAGGRGADLGTRASMADVGATIARWLGVGPTHRGQSFLEAM
jgi:phosphopentomutase